MGERSRLLRASVAVAVAGTGLVAAAGALDLEQFVAGWPIEAPAGAEVFDVPLTAEVYAAAASIEQLAVLDASGEPQAFFREGVPPATTSERRVVLEASPLYAGTQGGLTVGVTTNEGGTSVNVTPGASAEPATTGFVLDARTVDVAPVALELDWRALPQPFLLDVGVEQSADLTAWRNVGRASVAALSIGGAEVRHARVPVRAAAGGYFRITPRGGVGDWRLLRATLVSAAAEPVTPLSVRVPPLAETAEPALPDDAPEEALYFDAGGPLPVSSVALAFGGGDGWARGDVAASRALAGPWTTVAHDALFYSVSFEGRELAAEPLGVGRQTGRYWRVLPSAPPRGERVELVLEFPQERLRIAAGGGAPYLLVAGTLAEQAGPDPTLASVWSQLEPRAATVPLATLGARRELGGPEVLVAAWRFPWRTAALWAVLIVGVLVVGGMAVRLAQEMRSQSS